MSRMNEFRKRALFTCIAGALVIVTVVSPLMLAHSAASSPLMEVIATDKSFLLDTAPTGDAAPQDERSTDQPRKRGSSSKTISLVQASERYRQAAECAKFIRLQKGFEASSRAGELAETKFAQLDPRELEILERNVSFMEKSAGRCGANKEEDVYIAALSAALAGDKDASACFVASPWSLNKFPESEEVIALYKRYALQLANAAIARGDWRVVRLMADANGPFAPDGLIALIGRADPALQLRYLKLLEMGATSVTKPQLAPMIEQAARHLSAEQIAIASGWAKSTYHSYFRYAGPYDGAAADCIF